MVESRIYSSGYGYLADKFSSNYKKDMIHDHNRPWDIAILNIT
jgi:hypothetical protein